MSVVATIAIGMTFVIVNKGIDLSVGAVAALTTVLGGLFLLSGLHMAAVILLCLSIGAVIGCINGMTIAIGKLEPFIATLAMMTIARGGALLAAQGRTVRTALPAAMKFFGSGYVWVIPAPVLLVAVLYVIATVVMKKTVFGRYVYALGGNEEATRLSGVNTTRYRIAVYMVSSTLAALAGLLYLARLSVGEPTCGETFGLDAIASVAIGGTPFNGGAGGVWLTAIGVAVIGLINNILNLMNVSPYAQEAVKGLIILAAVFASIRKKNA
jgi:ribose/xylose/arabinose/galactoside ABC-type transport system permease subunit